MFLFSVEMKQKSKDKLFISLPYLLFNWEIILVVMLKLF